MNRKYRFIRQKCKILGKNGIHISRDFKWNRHIDETTAKANRTLGFLKRNLRMNSPYLKAKAYKGLVRPKVEYCSSVWDLRPLVENNGAYTIEMHTEEQTVSRPCSKNWVGELWSNAEQTAALRPCIKSHGDSSSWTLMDFCAQTHAKHATLIIKALYLSKLAQLPSAYHSSLNL